MGWIRPVVLCGLKGETHGLGYPDSHAQVDPCIFPTTHPPFVQGEHEKGLDTAEVGDGDIGAISAGQPRPEDIGVEL